MEAQAMKTRNSMKSDKEFIEACEMVAMQTYHTILTTDFMYTGDIKTSIGKHIELTGNNHIDYRNILDIYENIKGK